MSDHPTPDPATFVQDWASAWNRGDIDAVVAHFAEDAMFSSPRALEITGSAQVAGREQLRAYWNAARAAVATLHFTVDYFIADGSDLVVVYRSERDGVQRRACEFFRFDADGLVTRGEAMYGSLM